MAFQQLLYKFGEGLVLIIGGKRPTVELLQSQFDIAENLLLKRIDFVR